MPKYPVARIRVSKLVVVESLESDEPRTGHITACLLETLVADYAPILKVQYEQCETADEFRALIRTLTEEAISGREVPVLHLECHGSESDGIEFANGSCIAWDDLAQILNSLNVATSFNLLVVLAACYGAHLLGEIIANRPAPCWCVVAPTSTVDPAEILRGFRIYYESLLRTGDAGFAAQQLSETSVSSGEWFAQPAQSWFERLVLDYAKTHCNRHAAKARARAMTARLHSEGFKTTCDAMLEHLRRQNRTDLIGKYFDTYFSTGRIPGSAERFAATRERIESQLQELRATGHYFI